MAIYAVAPLHITMAIHMCVNIYCTVKKTIPETREAKSLSEIRPSMFEPAFC